MGVLVKELSKFSFEKVVRLGYFQTTFFNVRLLQMTLQLVQVGFRYN